MAYVRVRGFEKIPKKLETIGKRVKGRVRKGLLRGAKWIKKESQKIVPVDTGALKQSVYIDDLKDRGDDIIIMVGYGRGGALVAGKAPPSVYAILVHQDATMNHKAGKSDQYLMKPAKNSTLVIMDSIKREVNL